MINQIIAESMLVEGVVFGAIAYVMFPWKSMKLARSQRTWGDVIEVKVHSGGEVSTKHPVIRYKTLSGEDATLESKFGSEIDFTGTWRAGVQRV